MAKLSIQGEIDAMEDLPAKTWPEEDRSPEKRREKEREKEKSKKWREGERGAWFIKARKCREVCEPRWPIPLRTWQHRVIATCFLCKFIIIIIFCFVILFGSTVTCLVEKRYFLFCFLFFFFNFNFGMTGTTSFWCLGENLKLMYKLGFFRFFRDLFHI